MYTIKLVKYFQNVEPEITNFINFKFKNKTFITFYLFI